MKQHIALLLAILAIASATAQRSTLSATVRGIQGVNLVVVEPRDGRFVAADTITPNSKGQFFIERRSAEPQFFGITLTDEHAPLLHIFLLPKDKAVIDIYYNAELHQYNITEAKGSRNMEVYKQFNNILYTAATDATQQQQVPQRVEQLISANTDVLVSAFIVTFFENAFDQYAPLYKQVRDGLIGQYPTNEYVRYIDDRVNKALLPGSPAPDIAMAGRDGLTLRLSDLRGKVVLVDFWASWCRPCRMENPNVVRLYNKYHNRGFEVFSVSLDNNRDKWLEAIEADGLVWPYHVSDLTGWNSAGGRLYGITSIPATVLIDQQGNIIARNLRGQELENTLHQIFEQQ